MALLPSQYLNAVISIGTLKDNEKGEKQFRSFATGFLVGKKVNLKDKQGYRLFVVTNRHVYYNKQKDEYLNHVFFRLNTLEGKSHYFKAFLLNEKQKPIWYKHSDEKIDLAVLPISAKDIEDAKIEFYFFKEEDLFFAKDFIKNDISTGDDLFVLGFPMSISGNTRNFVIVRKGIIARVDEEILDDGYYYIDAAAYPGNSGGPVIRKPEIITLEGTKANNSSGLVGVISSGETYSDVAVSQQTGEAKIVFTEQTGLVRVVPVERIFDIVDELTKPNIDEAKVEVAKKDIVEEGVS
ncbi:serine protease [Patescibacteria group bacterium]|nr:serine protease [Patescibacteria group bacterium]